VAFDCTSQEKAAHGHVVHAVQEVPFWAPFDAVFDTSCPGNERCDVEQFPPLALQAAIKILLPHLVSTQIHPLCAKIAISVLIIDYFAYSKARKRRPRDRRALLTTASLTFNNDRPTEHNS
jgi:hypothetical protein